MGRSDSTAERNRVERESARREIGTSVNVHEPTADIDNSPNAVLAYLNSRGFTMPRFGRLEERITPPLDEQMLKELIQRRRNVFRSAVLERWEARDRQGGAMRFVGRRSKAPPFCIVSTHEGNREGVRP